MAEGQWEHNTESFRRADSYPMDMMRCSACISKELEVRKQSARPLNDILINNSASPAEVAFEFM
jgi:hypothetical protein